MASGDDTPRLVLRIEASGRGLVQGQHAVDAFLRRHDVVPRGRRRTLLLLEEAVMNVAMHAYADAGAHQVDVRVALAADGIELSLQDDGHPFDPRLAAPPQRPVSLAEARPGGLGVHLMRRFSRRMDYERRGGCNLLTLLIDRA